MHHASACPPTTSRPGRRSGRSPSRCTGPGPVAKACSSIATGGPGSSGIAEADYRLAGMPFDDHRLLRRRLLRPARDRAVPSPSAATRRSGSPARRSTPPRRTWSGTPSPGPPSGSWTSASPRPGWIPADADLYSTRQAAEDLEAFRDWLDADQLILYGESYGTRFQQIYAAAHPERVRGDGAGRRRRPAHRRVRLRAPAGPGLQRRPGGGPDRLRRRRRVRRRRSRERPRRVRPSWPHGSPRARSATTSPCRRRDRPARVHAGRPRTPPPSPP